MQDLRHLREYTRELKRRLPRECFEPVPTRLWWIIPHVAVVVAGIWAIGALSWGPWAKLGVSVLIGMSFASLGFLGHEILHGTVVAKGWVRDVTGGLCFFPFSLGPKLWRKWHNVEHHGNTQHDEDDPDAMATLEDYHRRPALQWLYRIVPAMRSFLTFASFSIWFSLHAFMMLRRFLPEFDRPGRRVVLAQCLVPVGCWLALAVAIGPIDFLFAYVIPLLIGNWIVMSYIATNHLLNPLTPVNDPLANSLTVSVPRWVDVLHFNFSHHTEHHIFPGMNPKYAPQVKALVKQLWPERYHEMPHWKALLTLWRTPRLYRERVELVDPVRGLAYPVLGAGLDPDNVQAKR